ncbi:MAG: hypothetical protein HDT21_08715 [Ruminococcus sp.]|nr:hypothetical protein [Ruminococcus sp.]
MSAPPRNAFAFLTPFTVLNERDFALCGARPKGSALWTSASWAQLDQLESAALPPISSMTLCNIYKEFNVL